jgi:hypothetical protein
MHAEPEPFEICPTMSLSSETHIVLENKQQQQQGIYEHSYEAIPFSFLPTHPPQPFA